MEKDINDFMIEAEKLGIPESSYKNTVKRLQVSLGFDPSIKFTDNQIKSMLDYALAIWEAEQASVY